MRNMYSQYNRKYKCTPAGTLNSTKAVKINKSPLGVMNRSITSTGVTSFKGNRSWGTQASSGRDKNAFSFRSSERANEFGTRGNLQVNNKKVSSKLKPTLPKSAPYKKYTSGIGNKPNSLHKKHTSGSEIQIYSLNSQREPQKLNYNSMVNNFIHLNSKLKKIPPQLHRNLNLSIIRIDEA